MIFFYEAGKYEVKPCIGMMFVSYRSKLYIGPNY